MSPTRILLSLLLLPSACGSPPPGTGEPPVYHSAAGRFTFAVPETWRGRYQIDSLAGTDPAAAHSGFRHMVTFSYLPEDTTIRPQVLLALVAMPRTEWEAMSREEGPPQGDVVAERADEVVIAGLPQSNPFDSLSPDGQRFARLRPTLDQVRLAVRLDTLRS